MYYYIFLKFKGKTYNNECMGEIKNRATFCGIYTQRENLEIYTHL